MRKDDLENIVKTLFPNHKYNWQGIGFWQIEASPFLLDQNIHYELSNNRVEFHIESYSSNWKDIRGTLYENWDLLIENNILSDKWWRRNDCSYFLKDTSLSIEEQLKRLCNVLQPIIDKYVENKGLRPKHIDRPAPSNKLFNDINNDLVSLYNRVTLEELFDVPLQIPDYQRIYCWDKRNVEQLFLDVFEAADTYHLGTIIIHKHDEAYDIVDGQQRLVTLTLLMEALQYEYCLPLLKQRFLSEQAKNYIAYNKYLCKQFVSSYNLDPYHIVKNICFNVLVINSENFELAYTFFSNENSRGKSLTDFNLLKAHHLRYIENESQQEHLATRWDNLTSKTDDNETDLEQSLGEHILRLRKWILAEIVTTEKYVVRNEYSASPEIDSVPAYGERFHFNESIIGGVHFFLYSEKMTERFREYANTCEHKTLVKNLNRESHYRYSRLIDSLLFGYYLKFGQQYLAEALYVIEKTVSVHRYTNTRALDYKIMEYVADSRIIMMIERSTSPTFFIAGLRRSEYVQLEDGIRKRYYECTKNMYMQILDRFTIKEILNDLKKVYEL